MKIGRVILYVVWRMQMPIKPYKTIDDQYQLLIKRGLKISDKNMFTDYILKNNYFNVINGNEDLLLAAGGSGKSYDTASFDDFIRLHKFDKTLTNHLIAILYNFETRLKTTIAKNFCDIYCRTPENTMQYTNKNNYRDIKSIHGSFYPLYHDQNKNLVDDFHKFICFKTGFLFNLVERNDFVDETVFSVDSSLYTPPSGCNSYQIKNNTKEVVVPLWVAIETFDFGALQRFCHYLNTNVMNKVLADFNLTPNDRDLFLNSLDVIRELRNKCAHFSLINRFSTSLSVKILPSLIKKQQLFPQEISRKVSIHTLQRKIRKNPAKLSLFDTLKVLAMYEDLSRLKKPLKALIYQNNKYFIKSSYDLNSRLLERMGNIDYIKWKELFS